MTDIVRANHYLHHLPSTEKAVKPAGIARVRYFRTARASQDRRAGNGIPLYISRSGGVMRFVVSFSVVLVWNMFPNFAVVILWAFLYLRINIE